MNGKDVLNGFDFDEYQSFDEKIDTITEIYGNSVVFDGKDFFGLESNTKFGQFVAHAERYGFSSSPGPSFEWTRYAAPRMLLVIR